MASQQDNSSGAGILHSAAFRTFLGRYILGGYLRFSSATSKLVYDPHDADKICADLMPAIFCCWHGQGMLGMKLVPVTEKLSILTSRHPDGQIVAAAAQSFGCASIDGSGASFRQDEGTGGFGAMREMLREMKRGQSIGITADIPPVPGRHASDGIALLARMSGRPIVPYAISSSNRTVLDKVWDKMQVNHPFSRLTVCIDQPVYVPKSTRDLKPYTTELAMKLDRTTARAFQLADKKPADDHP